MTEPCSSLPHLPRRIAAADVRVRRLGRVDYEPTWRAMQDFTAQRARRHAGRTLAARASAGLHAGPAGQARAPAARRQRHSGGEDRPRRPDHLSRPRPGRRSTCCSTCARRGLERARAGAALEQAVIDLLADYGIGAAARARRAGRLCRRRQDRRARAARDATAAATTASRSTSTWTSRPFAPSIPAAIPGCAVTQTRDLGIARRRREPLGDTARPRTRCDRLRMSATGEKQKGAAKTARIPIKIVPRGAAEQAGLDPRARRRQRRALPRDQAASCASTSCTPCARKPPAPTSANASARARRPS